MNHLMGKEMYLSQLNWIRVGACLMLVLILQLENVFAQQSELVSLPEKEKFYLFVLAGQSNMAGRGEIEEYDKQIPNRVLKQSQSGEWVPAVSPIHYDKPIAGVGPGRTFGISMAEYDSTITVGLIPCAVGGSSIIFWKPGSFFDQTESYPYDDCVKRIRQAKKNGILKAILWHQGETDSVAERAPLYKERLHKLITRLRSDFKNPKLPFIVGQLGNFKDRQWDRWRTMINEVHQNLPNEIKYTAFVSSKGLQHKGDLSHFDTKSARELGKRYTRAYIKMMEKKNNH